MEVDPKRPQNEVVRRFEIDLISDPVHSRSYGKGADTANRGPFKGPIGPIGGGVKMYKNL